MLRLFQRHYGVSNIKTFYSDGAIKCSFRRQIDSSAANKIKRKGFDHSKFFNIDTSYHLLQATGPVSGLLICVIAKTFVVSFFP